MGMIPDDELAAYTAVVLLDLTPAPTRLDSALVERVTGAIRGSLQRLNELPADDAFWVKTNRRPTVFKAYEWEGQQLAADPTDQRALWAVVSFTLLYCAYGAEQALRHLPAGDPQMIRWITGASEWVTLISGPDRPQAAHQRPGSLTNVTGNYS